MSDGAAHDEKSTFDGARLLRFAEALDATVEELRALPPGSLTVAELEGIVERTVAEAEAVIPAVLVSELRSLIAPIREPETERDLRLILGELDGWVRALLGSMGVAIPSVPAGEQEAD